MAYDAGKTAATADHIATTFFPALVPGKSLILHQDYLLSDVPWLAAQSWLLAEHMAPLARVGSDCLVFLWTKAASAAELAAANTQSLPDQKLIQSIRRAGEALADFAEDALFKAMIRAVKTHPGARKAWELRQKT